MSKEPSLKALVERAWHLRVESTQVKIQMVQTLAESICRAAAVVRRYFDRSTR